MAQHQMGLQAETALAYLEGWFPKHRQQLLRRLKEMRPLMSCSSCGS